MIEKNFQTLFKHWIANNPPKVASVYELKLEKKTSIAFDRVYEHQVAGLRQAKHKGLYHKIADTPMSWHGDTPMRFGLPKPFDCLFLKDLEAYVVIMFYVPRAIKRMYFIDIDRWCEEAAQSKRRSLTEARAGEIAAAIHML